MPSSAALQHKTDEAESRETSPELFKPEGEVDPEIEPERKPQPVTQTQEAHEVNYQRNSSVPPKKGKSK